MISRHPQQALLRGILRRCYSLSKPELPDDVITRMHSRNQRRIREFENSVRAADQFKAHRRNVVDILKDDTNIDALFTDESSDVKTVSNYDGLRGALGKMSYNDVEMRNTMMLAAYSLVESLEVEDSLRKIDDGSLTKALAEAQLSFDFESFQDYRFRFVHFKSSQHLNHQVSDFAKVIEGNQFGRFALCDKGSDEYLERFKKTFAKYEKNKDHVELGLGLVKDLLSGSYYIPTAQIWSYLLDKLGERKLHNFQQIIYLSLFQYKHQPTVLATPKDKNQSKPPLMADHFTHLVESYPEILSSLCKYQEARNDKETFIQLLSFLKLDKLAGEIMVLKSPLLSIAKFQMPDRCPGIALDSRHLTISRSCLYLIMRSSINLGLSEYVDLLYDKIVLDSVDPDNIQLNYVEQKLVQGQIFTPELFLIILESCKRSDNLGRLLWVLPFLDEYIATSQEIPQALKDSIFEVLNIYNLEGKVLSYKKQLCP
ncbi:hypothetical protein Cantr_04575 [Candida viswanathii]|uniref:Uncharacterized protein n=1 Tax=Candida viswanathii TaxID=5486 RepID=A0A367XP84_9ASCO|nr:hypothetical protein Cantr_04575 [Candida viswanathii]